MDRWDAAEFAGIACIVAFAAIVWWPAGLLVAGIALIVEAQIRSLGDTDGDEQAREAAS